MEMMIGRGLAYLSFEKFLKVTAIRTGQVLNVSELASDSGVSPPTAEKWLSILERAYIIKRIGPYLNNLTSRVRKSSKMYFLDAGLAAYLMGFRDADALAQSPHIGALFETLVFSDFVKRNANLGEVPEHYYLQTKSKVGMDLIVQKNQRLDLYEIKFTKTFQSRLTDQLTITASELKNVNSLNLLMPIETSYETKKNDFPIFVKNWNELN